MAKEVRDFVCESKLVSRNGRDIIAGIFQRAEVINENGRLYKTDRLRRIVESAEVRKSLADRTMLGQLGHPEDIEGDLKEAAIITTKLEMRDNGVVYGEAEIMPTPCGKILKILYESGVKMGISSRGYLPDDVDPIDHGEYEEVPDGYELVTFDSVLNPSTPGANPTLQESALKKINKIINENKSRIPKAVQEMVKSVKPINEEKQRDQLSFLRAANSRIGKEDNKMAANEDKEKYVLKLEGIAEDLRNRYILAEKVIKQLKAKCANQEKRHTSIDKANQVLRNENKAIRAQLGNSVKLIEELRSYAWKAEHLVTEMAKMQKTSNAVIEDLKQRYSKSEAVVGDLKNRYTLSEEVIADLRNRYLLAEKVVANLRQRYLVAEGAIKKLSRGYTLSEETIRDLRDSYLNAEGVVKELRNVVLRQRKAAKATSCVEANESRDLKHLNVQDRFDRTERALVNEAMKVRSEPKQSLAPDKLSDFLHQAAVKYGIQYHEAKVLFKKCNENKAAFITLLSEKKKMRQSNYTEYPYGQQPKRRVEEARRQSTSSAAPVQDAQLTTLVARAFGQ